MEESTHWECSLPSCAFLTSHSQKLPPWFVHRGRQTRTSEPAFTEATVMEQWRDLIHGARLPIQLDKVNEGKYPVPGWSPLKEREMRRRNEGEILGQPSWGDGSHTAQSVSLTTLPDTGWLTQNYTLFAKYQETVRLYTHTYTHIEIVAPAHTPSCGTCCTEANSMMQLQFKRPFFNKIRTQFLVHLLFLLAHSVISCIKLARWQLAVTLV